jgi:hypothetical protein
VGPPAASPSVVPGEARARPGFFASRRRRILAAATLAVGSSAAAISQEIAPPAEGGSFQTAVRGFMSPIVIGEAMQSIGCDLRAVTAADAKHVWVVGTLAFVARSDDGGRTWTQEPVEGVSSSGKPPARQPTQGPPPGSPGESNSGAAPKGALLQLFGLLEGTAHAGDAPPGETAGGGEKKAKKGKKTEKTDQAEKTDQRGAMPENLFIEPSSAPPATPVLTGPPDFLAIGSGPRPGLILSDLGGIHQSKGGKDGPIWAFTFDEAPERRPYGAAQIQGSVRLWTTITGEASVRSPGGSPNVRALLKPSSLSRTKFLTPGKVLFSVTGRGVVEKSEPGAFTELGKAPDGERIRGLFFTDDDHGWAVGEGGLILATSDGAKSWTKQPPVTKATLRGAFFLDDTQHGWAVGDQGTVLGTTDGGRRWTALTQPRAPGAAAGAQPLSGRPWRLPAPWYWLSLLALGLMVGPALRAPASEDAPPKETVANLFVTDRPVQDPAQDRMALNDVALGLSRFLRNDATVAPLTIAVTGDWGTGKSSLMKLLQTDLEHFGFRPVWFNAWHYQKEEHMLAGLLQTIRMQAVPGWQSIDGLRLRGRLLLARGWQFWGLVAAVAFLLSVSIAYEAKADGIFTALERGWKALFDVAPQLAKGELDAAWKLLADRKSSLGVIGGTLLTLFETVRRGARAFGIDPGALLAGRSGAAGPGALSAKTSFRQKFASELAQVTHALGAHKMIIFIDDLDRCRPDRVVETLEAVNFVVSSGECFVILGMAPERVIPCIALSFKDVAAEMRVIPPAAATAAATETARQKRARFAQEYLDKLINIEVPVPAPTSKQAADLLLDEVERPEGAAQVQDAAARAATPPPDQAARPGATETERVLPILRRFPARAVAAVASALRSNRQLVPSIVVAGVIVAAVVLGARVGTQIEATQEPVISTSDVGKHDDVKEEPVDDPGAQAVKRPDRTGQTAQVFGTSGMANPTPIVVLAALLLLLALIAWIAVNRRPDPVLHDSDKFKRALRIWNDVVYARRSTPRALKRFVNRVRFLAMAKHDEPRPGTLLDRIVAAATGDKPAPKRSPQQTDSADLKDETLVALAAIHEAGGDAFVAAAASELPAILARVDVSKAWHKHAATFQVDVAALQAAAKSYAERSKSVRAN